MFLIDCSMVNSGKSPLFAKEISVANDGGTIEYMGLGYKIIDFNRLNGYDETKVGLWYIKYEDFEEEYKKLDKDIVDEPNNNEILDDVTDNNIISGDEEIIENVSGDINSEDPINKEEINQDNIDVNEASGEIIDENEKDDDKFYFNATIIGINNNNLVVQALEDEAINASSDMFSFSTSEIDSKVYLIGQKIRIEYTGVIRESYPAQIDVLGIEILE